MHMYKANLKKKSVRMKTRKLFVFFFNKDFSIFFGGGSGRFGDVVSLCSPVCSGTCSIDQTSFELRDLLASASRMLG